MLFFVNNNSWQERQQPLLYIGAMTDLADRLEIAMKKRELKQPGLARAASTARNPVSQQNIQHLLRRRQKTSKHLPAIARALGIRLEWLTEGTGEMDPEQFGPQQMVPVISFVQAGEWTEVFDPNVDGVADRYISSDTKVSPRSYALQVRGTSQEPKYLEGDHIIVDPEVEPNPGDDVVAKLDGDQVATFKQFRPRGVDSKRRPIIELRPRNDAWAPIIMDANNPGTIIGTVVEHHSYRRSTGD